MRIVGELIFGGKRLDVYSSLDEPLFRASDVATMIDYGPGNTSKLLELCELDEKLNMPIVVFGQRRPVNFITERGLYSVLSQSRKPIARGWRRIIHDELVKLRISRNKDIVEQFDDWNNEMDNIYFDEETGMMMQSITIQVIMGGDV